MCTIAPNLEHTHATSQERQKRQNQNQWRFLVGRRERDMKKEKNMLMTDRNEVGVKSISIKEQS